MTLTLRWLGTAGFDLDFGHTRILVDPYLSRIPIHKYILGKVNPNPHFTRQYIQKADALLVSHSHIDHLFDVPVIAIRDGIPVFGSSNTCTLLTMLGVKPEQLGLIRSGDQFKVGSLSMTVHPSWHIDTPFFRSGKVDPLWKPPLTARQYVMDQSLSFHIQSADYSLLTAPVLDTQEVGQVDVLFVNPFNKKARLQQILREITPKVIIPFHWDEFWTPIDSPVRPMMLPPGSFRSLFQHLDLEKFSQWVKTIQPAATVIIPERFKEITLDQYLI